MKKSILSLGKNLNKTEQKLVKGGYHPPYCNSNKDCGDGFICNGAICYRP
ncbi:hypothetical protein [Tenacibaculum discolor]